MTRRTEMVILDGGASLAFTDYETEQLRKALLKETRRMRCHAGDGENLRRAARQRRSALRRARFINSTNPKEMLFFAVLESIHSRALRGG